MKLDLPPLFLFYFFWHPFLALLPSRSNSSSPVPTLPAQPAQCGGRAAPMEHGAVRGGHQLLRRKRRGRQKYQPKTRRKHLCGLESPSDEEPLSQELSRAHLLSPSWWERLVIMGGRPWWSSIQPWSSPPASSFPAQNPFRVFNHPSHLSSNPSQLCDIPFSPVQHSTCRCTGDLYSDGVIFSVLLCSLSNL